MLIRHYIKENSLKIPQKVVYHYCRKGYINDPLSEQDIVFLNNINSVWSDRMTVGCMLSKIPKKKRDALTYTWDLSKPETWAFSRFVDPKTISGYPPRIIKVKKELKMYHNAELSDERWKTIQSRARYYRFRLNQALNDSSE